MLIDLALMLGNRVAKVVNSQLYDWILAVSNALDAGSIVQAQYVSASVGVVGSGRLIDAPVPPTVGITTVYVKSFKDWFRWDPLSTALSDNVTTVALLANGTAPGRFVRALIPAPEWMLQTTWIIDEANTSGTANDENSGLTGATALLTDDERVRRMGRGARWGNATIAAYHLHYISSPTRPILFMGSMSPTGVNIYVHGSLTPGQGQPGGTPLVVNAMVAVNHATNTPLQITSNGLVTSWTADGLLNKRCRFTSGANVGGVMWPTAEPGPAKTARMSECCSVASFANPFVINLGTFIPALNDTFIVETLTTLPEVYVDLVAFSPFDGATNAVCFDSVLLDNFIISNFGSGINVFGCDWKSALINGFSRIIQVMGSRFRANSIVAANVLEVGNCYHSDEASGFGTFRVYGTGSLISRHMVEQRLGLALSTPILVNQASSSGFKILHIGIFGNTGSNAIDIAGIARLDGIAEIWGVCGAGGTPFALSTASALRYNAVPPGHAPYFYVNVAAAPAGAWISYRRAAAWQTSAPAFDTATSTFTSYRVLTPANLQASLGAGGVNGEWFDPVSGCGMASV
jgi:hypothetical protein